VAVTIDAAAGGGSRRASAALDAAPGTLPPATAATATCVLPSRLSEIFRIERGHDRDRPEPASLCDLGLAEAETDGLEHRSGRSVVTTDGEYAVVVTDARLC